MTALRTDRLLLRPFVAEDHDGVHAYASDPEVVRFQDWGPNSPADTAAFLDMTIAAAGVAPRAVHPLAVVRAADGVLIGGAELRIEDDRHRRGGLGCTLARAHWGHGYATEAAAALLAFGFDLGLHRVTATCDPENAASARVLEKIGMRREGLLEDHLLVRGERRDRLLYAALAYRIGPATAADLPRLVAIRHAAFAAHAPAAYPPDQVATLLDDVDPAELRRMTAERRLFVARRGDAVLGLAGWQEDRVRHVYADPAYTRRGIASALLRRAEADCRARTGVREVRAGVALHAEPFYRANGYRLVRRATAWDGSEYLEMVHGGVRAGGLG